jgi:hypothetical protein
MEPLWSPVVAISGNHWQRRVAAGGANTSQNRCRGLRPVAAGSAWQGGGRRFESVRGLCKSAAKRYFPEPLIERLRFKWPRRPRRDLEEQAIDSILTYLEQGAQARGSFAALAAELHPALVIYAHQHFPHVSAAGNPLLSRSPPDPPASTTRSPTDRHARRRR